MLAVVFAMIFVMLTLVAVLHHQQVAARRDFTRASADLQFEQARRISAARSLGIDFPTGDVSLSISGDSDPAVIEDELDDASAKLWDELPDLAVGEDTKLTSASSALNIAPSTFDQTLKVFGEKVFHVVARESDAYAIYAPNGSVTVTNSVVGWANPTFKNEEDDAEKVYSGVPATIFANSEVRVGKLAYGSAYSQKGPLSLGKGLAVGFIGPGPKRDYAVTLKSKLDNARDELDRNAKKNGDKTSTIKGSNFEKLEKFAALFKEDGKLEDAFSPTLEEAIGFNMPIIPGGTKHPPFIIEFWFHVPWKSDFVDFGEPEEPSEQKDDLAELEKLDEAYKAAVKKVTTLESDLAKATSDSERDRIQDKLEDARDDRDEKETKLENAGDEVKDNLKKKNESVGDNIPTSVPEPPKTRRDDLPKKKHKSGTPGHNYSGLFANMWELLTGNQNVLDTLAPKVRLVHFGDMDNDADDNFDFSDSYELSTAVTWTVPRGRCFRYAGDLVVEGDIWIQRGGIFAVDGDLTLENPSTSLADGANPLKPKGRLHLEEGATLIVDGDFTAAGSLAYGSVQVGGLPGEIHPISSAILCTGAVSLPYGSYSATTLDDLVRWVGKETSAPALGDAANIMTPIFSNTAPNLAKIAGPFHLRKPYFSQFASTFVLVTVLTPVGPVPIPAPTFLPRKNALIPVFKGLTYLYTTTMNWNLGENLYTHADWWFFGDGAVPMFPKIDPIRASKGLLGLNLSQVKVDIDWEAEIEKQSEEIITKVVEKILVDLTAKIATKLAAAAIPYGIGAVVDAALDEIFNALDLEQQTLGELASDLAKKAVEPLQRAMKSVLSQLEDQIKDGINDGLLRELSGVLIYAETIDVGYDGNSMSTQAMVTSGMFVAERGIRMNCNTTVGTVTSFDGDVELNRLLYIPYFSRASLYKPKDILKNDFVARGLDFKYGKEHASSLFIDIDTGAATLTTQGWNR
jgi:hypothetical protein